MTLTRLKLERMPDWENKVSESVIRSHIDNLTEKDWRIISYHQKLSEDFIREFSDKVNWNLISCHETLSESFIREFSDKVNWRCISKYQKLSEDFIREFSDKIDWTWPHMQDKLYVLESKSEILSDLEKVGYRQVAKKLTHIIHALVLHAAKNRLHFSTQELSTIKKVLESQYFTAILGYGIGKTIPDSESEFWTHLADEFRISGLDLAVETGIDDLLLSIATQTSDIFQLRFEETEASFSEIEENETELNEELKFKFC